MSASRSSSKPHAVFSNIKLTTREKRIDPETGKITWVDVEQEHRVDLELDLHLIMRELGIKAASNRSKKSRALGGLVRVSVRPIGIARVGRS